MDKAFIFAEPSSEVSEGSSPVVAGTSTYIIRISITNSLTPVVIRPEVTAALVSAPVVIGADVTSPLVTGDVVNGDEVTSPVVRGDVVSGEVVTAPKSK